jgi:hypothetical protein
VQGLRKHGAGRKGNSGFNLQVFPAGESRVHPAIRLQRTHLQFLARFREGRHVALPRARRNGAHATAECTQPACKPHRCGDYRRIGSTEGEVRRVTPLTLSTGQSDLCLGVKGVTAMTQSQIVRKYHDAIQLVAELTSLLANCQDQTDARNILQELELQVALAFDQARPYNLAD